MSHSPRAKAIYLHALTPVHSGTGQAVAVVDLPIAREKATGWPIIPASSLKGVLRDALETPENKAWIARAFGKDVRDGGEMEAGALCFTDQRILCLAVRSFYGTFAYATCPLVLGRFVRDMRAFGLEPPFTQIPAVAGSGNELQALVTQKSDLARNGKVYLEDIDLTARPDSDTEQIASGIAGVLFADRPEAFTTRFVIVSDEVFNFLSETAIEVAARVRLEDDTKTVKKGALWYEEAVPAESIFAGAVMVADFYKEDAGSLWEPFQPSLVQIGGDSSVGRGLCRVVTK
ncbi:MAG: type III-B CRISPR module RAMP protein Cmr4 [Chthonomonadetes bacterium]|nr:type III-B CRISPR module RAMP protein Cmr4 [Chthonomonadetes bacterium]